MNFEQLRDRLVKHDQEGNIAIRKGFFTVPNPQTPEEETLFIRQLESFRLRVFGYNTFSQDSLYNTVLRKVTTWNRQESLNLPTDSMNSIALSTALQNKDEWIEKKVRRLFMNLQQRDTEKRLLEWFGIRYSDSETKVPYGHIYQLTNCFLLRFYDQTPPDQHKAPIFFVPPAEVKNIRDAQRYFFPNTCKEKLPFAEPTLTGKTIYYTTKQVHGLDIAVVEVDTVSFSNRRLPIFARSFAPRRGHREKTSLTGFSSVMNGELLQTNHEQG